MVEEPTDDRENAEADEDGASAPVPEKVRFFYALKVLFRFSLSDSLSFANGGDVSMKAHRTLARRRNLILNFSLKRKTDTSRRLTGIHRGKETRERRFRPSVCWEKSDDVDGERRERTHRSWGERNRLEIRAPIEQRVQLRTAVRVVGV